VTQNPEERRGGETGTVIFGRDGDSHLWRRDGDSHLWRETGRDGDSHL